MACYLLRRNFCSTVKNICGLTDVEADILMGHALARNVKKNLELNCPDDRRRIAEMLERWVVDPEESLNPALKPIVPERDKLELVPHRTIRLRNNGFLEMTVKLDVCVEELEDELQILVPRQGTMEFGFSSEKVNLGRNERRIFCEEAFE